MWRDRPFLLAVSLGLIAGLQTPGLPAGDGRTSTAAVLGALGLLDGSVALVAGVPGGWIREISRVENSRPPEASRLSVIRGRWGTDGARIYKTRNPKLGVESFAVNLGTATYYIPEFGATLGVGSPPVAYCQEAGMKAPARVGLPIASGRLRGAALRDGGIELLFHEQRVKSVSVDEFMIAHRGENVAVRLFQCRADKMPAPPDDPDLIYIADGVGYKVDPEGRLVPLVR